MVPSRTNITLDIPNSYSWQNFRALGTNTVKQFSDGQHKKNTGSEFRENSEVNHLTFGVGGGCLSFYLIYQG